jgi:hypothetical protein
VTDPPEFRIPLADVPAWLNTPRRPHVKTVFRWALDGIG